MRKLLSFFLVLALVVCVMGYGYAASKVGYDQPDSENVLSEAGFGGSVGTTPPTIVIKVRYATPGVAAQSGGLDNSLTSGDVVDWSLISADGYSVVSCDASDTLAYSYAGVMVTDVATTDNVVVSGGGKNVGWMAIKGYCLANVDTSLATAGAKLVPNGATLKNSFGTHDAAGLGTSSADIGVLLRDTGTDGVMPVWLR